MADPFDALGLEPRFDLPTAEVERAYLARAAACHPDLAGGGPAEDAEAARLAATINDAKAVLLNPESRARALLARLGAGVAGGGPDRDLPEGFLMGIMQTRMEVEEALVGGQATELARWRDWAAGERRSYIERIDGLFSGLSYPPSSPALDEIRRQLNAWRYIERMLEQIPD